MERLFCDFKNTDMAKIARCDIGELSVFLEDLKVCQTFAATELSFPDCDLEIRSEAISLRNDFQSLTLTAMPCVRGLLREAINEKVTSRHGEMLHCAVSSYPQLIRLMREMCDVIDPDMIPVYEAKFI